MLGGGIAGSDESPGLGRGKSSAGKKKGVSGVLSKKDCKDQNTGVVPKMRKRGDPKKRTLRRGERPLGNSHWVHKKREKKWK